MNAERVLTFAAAAAMFAAFVVLLVLFEDRAAQDIGAVDVDPIDLGPDVIWSKPDRAGTRGASSASRVSRRATESGGPPDSVTRASVADRLPKTGSADGSPVGTAPPPSQRASAPDPGGGPSSADGAPDEGGRPPVEGFPPANPPPSPPPPSVEPAPVAPAPPPAEVELQSVDDDEDDVDPESGLEPAAAEIEDDQAPGEDS
jgi:hypothetical protein